MPDSALLRLAEQVRRAVVNLPPAELSAAGKDLDDASTALSPLVQETEHLSDAINGWALAREEIDQARQVCDQIRGIAARYLASLGVPVSRYPHRRLHEAWHRL